jgi:hypothetical protein
LSTSQTRGQYRSRRFTYQDNLVQEMASARDFAFKALSEGNFLKGFICVHFQQAASYTFRFERTGLLGYRLAPTQDQPKEPPFVLPR